MNWAGTLEIIPSEVCILSPVQNRIIDLTVDFHRRFLI